MYLKHFLNFKILIILFSVNILSEEYITIGTFNIAWLGDGIEDKIYRTKKDYKNLAEIIINSNADIIALQEIENRKSLEMLLKYLKDWSYYIESSEMPQTQAFIFKKNIKIKKLGFYKGINTDSGITRPALVAHFEINDFDFLIFNVHFKSTSRYDNTEEKKLRSYDIRKNQAEKTSIWLDSVLKFEEKDVVILGDFNDNPIRKKGILNSLTNSKQGKFISSKLRSCKNYLWQGIDHIFLSNNLLDNYQKNSLFVYNIYNSFKDEEVTKISDHCPVLFTLVLD